MTRSAVCLVALALLTGPSTAAAQEPPAPAAPATGAVDWPRLELGVGVSNLAATGTNPYTKFMVDGRVGLKLGRRWSLEGLVHVPRMETTDVDGYYSEWQEGYYRVQVVWRIGQKRLQPFLAFGGAGEMNRYRHGAYAARDSAGNVIWTQAAGSASDWTPPYYPVITVGLQKALGSRLAVRADLTVTGGINDYGVAPAFMPAVSLSLPIGRYRSVR